MEKTASVELIGLDGKKASGEVRMMHWEAADRRKRALKSWGLFWGIGLFCVIIPLAHFILVPSFLLAGPIVAFFVYNQTDVILGGTGTCPDCGKPFKVARMKIQWPLNDICSECHSAVKIYTKNNT
jgi:hypothetical protein